MPTKFILNSLINIVLFHEYKLGKTKEKSIFHYYRNVKKLIYF